MSSGPRQEGKRGGETSIQARSHDRCPARKKDAASEQCEPASLPKVKKRGSIGSTHRPRPVHPSRGYNKAESRGESWPCPEGAEKNRGGGTVDHAASEKITCGSGTRGHANSAQACTWPQMVNNIKDPQEKTKYSFRVVARQEKITISRWAIGPE